MRKILTLPLIALVIMLMTPQAYAQDIADQPCDAGYWKQLSARAWLEAEREIMQNQNLIFKPDSVLEYTCFDQYASIAAWAGGNIFVHTKYFGPQIITREAPEAMQKAMASVVSNALNSYKSGNFSHSFLGGRAQHMGIANKNSAFKPATTNQSYTCKTMADVWKTAKCANFVDNSNFSSTDGFYPFEAIKGYNGGKDVAGYADTIKETRQYPSSMACSGDSQGAGESWEKQLEIAENKPEDLYKFQTPLGEIFKEVGEKLEPGNCTAPIKTGVMVIIDEEESHEDGVCTNPGCSYTKEGQCS